MSRREKREEKQNNKTFRKIIIVAIFLFAVFNILKFAPNYEKNDITDRANLIVNDSNITTDLKKPMIIENNIIYLSKQDIQNFFDPNIYYEEKYNQIITGSETKIASIEIGKNIMTNNGSNIEIEGTVIKRDDTYYIPFSELEDIYNVKIKIIKSEETADIIVVESLNKQSIIANSTKDTNVKYRPTKISKNIEKVKKGDSIVLSEKLENGWVKVRTQSGKLGYMPQSELSNETEVRKDLNTEKQINGKVSLIWEYFSEYGQAPSRNSKLKGVNAVSPTFFTLERLGKGKIVENVGDAGKAYIKWAHDKGYKVWPSLSNNSMIDTTSEIMRDYKLRQELINKVVSLVVNYDLDGINIDFENMYAEDKDLFSRFIIELAPRLREIGAVLSVDVTAPDGSDTWSMCYDRHIIGKIADYIVFMAYDQNGISSPVEGTTAGCDWVEANIQKFVGTQEEISSDKIILGIPFYTRVWETTNGKVESSAVDMKDLNKIIPNGAKKTWDDSLKQYIVEYKKGNTSYKIWMEDTKSIEAKLDLIEKYNLAGAAYWEKGRETNDVWDIVSNKLGVN